MLAPYLCCTSEKLNIWYFWFFMGIVWIKMSAILFLTYFPSFLRIETWFWTMDIWNDGPVDCSLESLDYYETTSSLHWFSEFLSITLLQCITDLTRYLDVNTINRICWILCMHTYGSDFDDHLTDIYILWI